MFKVYKMGSRPKGLALIVNIKTFVNNCEEERLGSKYDVQQLQNLLTQLDYRITTCDDLTRSVSIDYKFDSKLYSVQP